MEARSDTAWPQLTEAEVIALSDADMLHLEMVVAKERLRQQFAKPGQWAIADREVAKFGFGRAGQKAMEALAAEGLVAHDVRYRQWVLSEVVPQRPWMTQNSACTTPNGSPGSQNVMRGPLELVVFTATEDDVEAMLEADPTLEERTQGVCLDIVKANVPAGYIPVAAHELRVSDALLFVVFAIRAGAI